MGVIANVFKRTINIADYRNAKDNVNPTKDQTFGLIIHKLLDVYGWVVDSISDSGIYKEGTHLDS
jgi:hypothetical protein